MDVGHIGGSTLVELLLTLHEPQPVLLNLHKNSFLARSVKSDSLFI